MQIERQHSREQSDKIINLAEQLAELSRNNQILLGAEQQRMNPLLYIKDNKVETENRTQIGRENLDYIIYLENKEVPVDGL